MWPTDQEEFYPGVVLNFGLQDFFWKKQNGKAQPL